MSDNYTYYTRSIARRESTPLTVEKFIKLLGEVKASWKIYTDRNHPDFDKWKKLKIPVELYNYVVLMPSVVEFGFDGIGIEIEALMEWLVGEAMEKNMLKTQIALLEYKLSNVE